MTEIGYEDCDYIAHEESWTLWPDTILPQLANVPFKTLELHVPCRKPALDHLLSMCNFFYVSFDYCQAGSDPSHLKRLINKCLRGLTLRYHPHLTQPSKNNHYHYNKTVTVKCFQPIPVETYVQYMSQRLRPKRKHDTIYHHRATNKNRNRTNECIWNDLTLQQEVHNTLLQIDPYFRFCDQCLGSENDLFFVSSSDNG